jgi:hypothetical protein
LSSPKIITPQEFNRQQEKIGSATQRRERAARFLHERKKRAMREQSRLAHPGRPMRRAAGGWVTDMAETQNGILLCPTCSPRFNPKQYGYYRTREFVVHGPCDGCKQYAPMGQATFFIHESLLGQNHGQCWKPR